MYFPHILTFHSLLHLSSLPLFLHGNFSCHCYQWPPCCQGQCPYSGLFNSVFQHHLSRPPWSTQLCCLLEPCYPPIPLIIMPLHLLLLFLLYLTPKIRAFQDSVLGPLPVPSLPFICHARLPVNPKDFRVGLNQAVCIRLCTGWNIKENWVSVSPEGGGSVWS